MPPERPRTNVRPVVAWVAAAVVAVAVASWGVGLVSRSVTDDRPAPLEAAQIQQRLEQATASTTTAAGSPTSSPTTGAGAPSTTAAPGTPTTTVAGGVPTTSTTAVAPPPTTAPAPTTTAAGETRTYALVGGTVALRFSPGGVTVVFANPAAGFDVEVEPEHVNGVKVEFESEAHTSRVDGWWDGGPQERVEERSGDD